MTIRRPTILELVAQLVIVAFVVLPVTDVLDAYWGYACSEPGSRSDCYPWGSEGPVADRWGYESKAAYIGTGLASIVVLTVSGLAPLMVSRATVGLSLMAAGFVAGGYMASFV
ncbi:hypothetical protein [Ensifer sp. SSB1]|jgi:hypothetical protein|uniref:hypothetical protein n=1 Tax=Ensifer sp. SSB1 TaxID=2795385 RepID=UPI001A597A70|nr:hypothetical protein [Ensifer sp. SSB1]MBK5565606.1 hypothetical protein [Ensifer sp. SSB1]